NKGFLGKKPRTVCTITDAGRKAFEEYVDDLRQYLHL
ncbi:transcriptional regulator, partial [uncultured Muribaculum sp.]